MSEQTVEQYKAALAAEYGKYVAAERIEINGVAAFNEGDAVPVGHVESGVVRKDQVRTVKAAPATKES